MNKSNHNNDIINKWYRIYIIIYNYIGQYIINILFIYFVIK